jgi:hypothetical protein
MNGSTPFSQGYVSLEMRGSRFTGLSTDDPVLARFFSPSCDAGHIFLFDIIVDGETPMEV